jgi:hypothetical protein
MSMMHSLKKLTAVSFYAPIRPTPDGASSLTSRPGALIEQVKKSSLNQAVSELQHPLSTGMPTVSVGNHRGVMKTMSGKSG